MNKKQAVILKRGFLKNLTMTLIVLLTISLIFTLIKVQAENEKNTEETQNLIHSFYSDSDHRLLRRDISEEELVTVTNQVYSINSWNKRNLLDQLSQVQSKNDALAQISSVYDTEGFIDLDINNLSVLPLQEDINLETMGEVIDGINFVSDAEFNNYLQLQYEAVIDVLEEIDYSDQSVKSLAIEVDPNTLTEDLEHYQLVEENLLPHAHHPQAQQAIEVYKHNGKIFAENLSKNQEHLKGSEGAVNLIFDTEILASELSGSAFDSRPLVSLTFDDGPSEFTPEILDILSKYDVQATFFQLGRYIELYPEISQMVVGAGHLIGNHSYSHANFDLLTDSLIRQETQKTQELIYKTTGVETTLYRTPYGNGRNQMVELYPDMVPIYWNVDSEDWVSKDADTTINQTLETLEHRSIILMHDSQESTVEALSLLIPELQSRGYIFVTPDKIPEADNYAEDLGVIQG